MFHFSRVLPRLAVNAVRQYSDFTLFKRVVPAHYSEITKCWHLLDRFPHQNAETINIQNWNSTKVNVFIEGKGRKETEIFLTKNGTGFIPTDKIQ
jgi:hypothetical protein